LNNREDSKEKKEKKKGRRRERGYTKKGRNGGAWCEPL
jgi:hypothetical protein